MTTNTIGGLANPFMDSQFKQIFDRENTRLFLNSALRLASPIKTLEIKNTESNDTSTVGKRVYFDVFCQDESGNQFIVEMQNVWKGFLKNRLIYYTSRKMDEMGRQYEKKDRPGSCAEWKYDIKRVCTVCLLNDDDGDTGQQLFRQDILLYDVENGIVFSDRERIVIINLKLLDIKTGGGDSEYYRLFLALLKQISTNMNTAKELLSEIDGSTFTEEQKSIFRRVVYMSDVSAMDEDRRQQYEEELKNELDYRAVLQDSYDQGIDKGRAEGRVEGKVEGKAEGKTEAKLDVARNMKSKGYDISIISELTGLPEKAIIRTDPRP